MTVVLKVNFVQGKITEKGIMEYTKWIKNFLEFAREAIGLYDNHGP